MEESAYIGGLGRGLGGNLSAQQPVVVVGVGGGASVSAWTAISTSSSVVTTAPVFLLNE
jgi:hypothetical protein